MLGCVQLAGIQLKIILLLTNYGNNNVVSKGDDEHEITGIFEVARKACHSFVISSRFENGVA